MKNNIDGILVIDKPYGITSRDVVNKLSKKFGTKKIGHTGTLDPIATGVLVCLLGKYTKLSNILTSDIKSYRASFKLGIETDSLDITGNMTKTSCKKVTSLEIKDAINSFVGIYAQEVPAYSAVKINGKKLYEYARENIEIPLPKRDVTIYSIDNISIDDEISFDVTVSKGTYIRSLIRDIGHKLGTYATMTKLIRTRQGEFYLKDAQSLDLDKDDYKFLKIEDIIDKESIVNIDENLYKKVVNGVKIRLEKKEDVVLFRYDNEDVCLYKKDGDYYRMLVKFI